jgi:hypothetical protein
MIGNGSRVSCNEAIVGTIRSHGSPYAWRLTVSGGKVARGPDISLEQLTKKQTTLDGHPQPPPAWRLAETTLTLVGNLRSTTFTAGRAAASRAPKATVK